MSKWVEIRNNGDFRQWGEALLVDPLCARVIRNRGIDTIDDARKYLEGGEELLHDPFLLPDMEKAVEGLIKAIRDKQKIRIIGDYDVDGVTSTYILHTCISAAGGDVSYAIPNRMTEGYGINDDMVRDAKEEGVNLIITCDNGIAASEQVSLAYELGLEVIVTDHHQVPFAEDEDGNKIEILPECMAVVDPHREGSDYPFKGICGAMVAYKFMTALFKTIPSEGLKTALDNSRQFAALGTVCDVMELTDENRAIVRLGISDMQHTDNKGIKALMAANSLTAEKINAYTFGFVIGPSINSTGRLETANESVELLLSENAEWCLKTATRIRELNDERKNMTAAGVEAAVRQIEAEGYLEDKVLVIFLEGTHESIAGLIAGRLKEKYYRPVLVITKGEEGLKGSGRSIPAYNMFEKLSEVRELFTRMGGHAMAAGFSLDEENLTLLRKRLNENSGLTNEDFERVIRIDGVVPVDYPSVKLVKDLEKLEPVGTGNAGALFAQRDAVITLVKRMGAEGKYGALTILSGRKFIRMTYFGDMDEFDVYIRSKYGDDKLKRLYDGKESLTLNICYELKLNKYKEKENVDYRLKYYN